ncbi:tetratricopeptide repeat domain protein [Luminiphilus syltensis NOR5-1B]|uniref:Tetratricopeptide repeat domain protein n=1 Tax=Luminiphilus syltensis NOR5-1B TaxID=565045 RepID=B8KVZ2_9GAMM|nr:tetratricopeptide repeat protein [Luminiphilus syltensis]EED36531.1 tetratricopeptide repeat domain protein [Luminiphilus syltensis NOR5-1B]
MNDVLTSIELPAVPEEELAELRKLGEDALKAGSIGPASLAIWQILSAAPRDDIGHILLKRLSMNDKVQRISYAQVTPLVKQYSVESNHQAVLLLLALMLLKKPDDPYAVNHFANAASQCGRVDLALLATWNGYQKSPNDPRLINALATALYEAEQFDSAIKLYRDLLDKRPNSTAVIAALGSAQARSGDPASAMETLSGGLEQHPGDADLMLRLGLVSKSYLLRVAGAGDSTAIEQANFNINAREAAVAKAAAYVVLGDFEKSVSELNSALEWNPKDHDVRASLANLQLMVGDYDAGFSNYSARFELEPELRLLESEKPQYTGAPLDGKTLLVWGEQGLGEQILFAPALEVMLNEPGRIIFATDSRLVARYQERYPDVKVVDRSNLHSLSGFDFQISAGDLFAQKWQELQLLPGDLWHPLLMSDKESVAECRASFPMDRPLIGVSWRGGRRDDPSAAAMRSLELKELLSAAVNAQVTFVNLQYGDCAAEVRKLGDARLVDSGIDNFNDIDSLLQLMAACDAVVTVDNANAHLAAAVGTDTHLVVPKQLPSFRWKNKAIQQLIFPAVTVHEQQTLGDWSVPAIQCWKAVLEG